VIECGSIEYAQARLQSRHGRRASEAQWQQLESIREFGALLGAGFGDAPGDRPLVGDAHNEASLAGHQWSRLGDVFLAHLGPYDTQALLARYRQPAALGG